MINCTQEFSRLFHYIFFADFPAHLFTRVFFQILFCGYLRIKINFMIGITSNNYDKKSANSCERKSAKKDLMKNPRKNCLPSKLKKKCQFIQLE